MNLKIHSNDLSRVMRIMSSCIETKMESKNSNVEICYGETALSIRAMNNSQHMKMTIPMMGGDGETICVDGKMLANVASRANGMVEISSNNTSCVIKANGRTRLPVVKVDLDNPAQVEGKSITVKAEDFIRAWNRVKHAVATDESRVILTGVLIETINGELTVVALDGYQLSVEKIPYDGDDISIVIPGSAMKKICEAVLFDEELTIVAGSGRVLMRTDSAELTSGLLAGEYIDYKKLLPLDFKTEVLFKTSDMIDIIKESSVVGSHKNLVKMHVGDSCITISSNSEQADFTADLACEKNGNDLDIAFNVKYVANALNAIDTDEAIMKLNSPISPAVFYPKNGNGIKLALPVRVMG